MNFAQVLADLRVHPAEYPIRVRRRPLGFLLGSTRFTKRNGRWIFEIEIHSALPGYIAKMVLVHEWAHCLTWSHDGPDHSDEWGIAFARLWREIFYDGDYQI